MGKSKIAMENERIFAALPDDDRIAGEYTRLISIYEDVPKEKLRLVRKLISRAAFMAVTLDDLEKTISEEGCTSEYQNGENQWGKKKSPEVDVYNTMVKNYAAVMKQLADMIPGEAAREGSDDGFEAFTNIR